MSQSAISSSLRPWLLGVGAVAAVALLAVQLLHSPEILTSLQMHDFVEYWAAGRLIAQGDNPYDIDRMHDMERLVGRTEPGILMWNPPWTLPLVLPFGLLEVRVAHLLWLVMHVAVLGFCADRLWLLYGGDRDRRWVSWLIALTFLPSLFALTAGQITPLVLLGAVGFLFFMERKQETLAGVAAVLIGVKPHLAYLFWIALALWSVRERRWKSLAAGSVAGLALTAIPLLFNSHLLQDYWHAMTQKPPAQYRSPTIGTVLRLAFGEDQFRLQFLALIPGLLWFVPHWWIHRREWTWKAHLPLLLTVSVLTTAYGGWPFDLVLLLLPVLHAATVAARWGWGASLFALLVLGVINTVAATQLAMEVEYFWFIWITPAVLASYYAVRWLAARFSPAETSAAGCAGN
jgi:hypothetical protein